MQIAYKSWLEVGKTIMHLGYYIANFRNKLILINYKAIYEVLYQLHGSAGANSAAKLLEDFNPQLVKTLKRISIKSARKYAILGSFSKELFT